MIRHTVILKLKPNLEHNEINTFFDVVAKLAEIPNVKKFELLKQVSPKNNYEYGISMEFDNQIQYDNYANHKDHLTFVEKYWSVFVEDFLEIDYTIL